MHRTNTVATQQVNGLRVNAARLRADIEALANMGRTPDGALARYAFSPAYEEARAWLKTRMTNAGIAVRDDAAGNTIGRIGPDGAACVMTGSHIDTVPDGGPLDGALGVLAGLEVARVINEARLELPLALECVAFIEEEGRFLGRMGSKAVAGVLDQRNLEDAVDPNGYKLTEAMHATGFDPSAVTQARRLTEDIYAYVELHIEQGPVLEQLGVPIGVVEAIVATNHTRVTFEGEPDHAGTAPMHLRRDAFTGAAEYACRARELVLKEGSEGQGRLTFGVVDLKPQVANVVPYQVRLLQDIRDVSDTTVAKLVARTKGIAEDVATRHRLTVRHEHVSGDTAAVMSEDVRTTIREVATTLQLATYDMPSGAAHDAQIMARIVPAGMIFVPSAGGRSHRRDERTDWVHLEQGANVLLHTVLRLLTAES